MTLMSKITIQVKIKWFYITLKMYQNMYKNNCKAIFLFSMKEEKAWGIKEME